MLTDQLKKDIQQAYSRFLESKSLKPRYGQKLMVAAIARTLGGIQLDDAEERESEGHVCVIEAGTGTGKTVGYLLPAIVLAKAMGKKLVISTATVALQEQIVHKDLPDLRQHSELDFSFSLAKGRGRYMCLSKLDRVLVEQEAQQDPNRALYEDEMLHMGEQSVKIYTSMMEAMAANRWDGDRDNWAEGIGNEDWARITTDHRQCTGRRCSNVGSCSFVKARDGMGNVDCVVANHDLVLADLALGGGAILPDPADTFYIFDEGHHLPDKAINHFAHHSRVTATLKWLEQCHKANSSMLGEISGAGNIDRFGEQLPAAIADAKQQMALLLPLVESVMATVDTSDHTPRYRFANGVIPHEWVLPCQEAFKAFERLDELLKKMLKELDESLEDRSCDVPRVDMENWYPVLGIWQSRAEANMELWASYASPDNNGAVPKARWVTLVEQGSGVDFEVCSSPILAAKTLEYSLWRRCCGAVVTSATLTALGKFDRYQMRAGTPANSCYEQVPSPFDFASATLQVPAWTVEANDAHGHTLSLVDNLPELLNADEASLVLFSSRRQMQEVYEALDNQWQDRILVQGDRSKQALLNTHKQRVDDGEGSILFGLASFAEGLDLPGDYCRHVVIAKLPFSVPDDPVEAALAEWVETRGGNAFMEITVPDASLRLIQACGRLLRRESDTGTITIADKRIVSKRYGKALLNALPPFTQRLS